jgi:phospholipase C
MFPKFPPTLPDAKSPLQLPAQTHLTIGDLLTKKKVDWAWYAGAWQMTLDGTQGPTQFPTRPNFQLHHQPFNYFESFAPGTTQREQALRDGGLGSSSTTNKFIATALAGKLPQVAFYKRKAISTCTPAIQHRGWRRPYRCGGGSPAAESAMAEHARRHHLRRERRLVGSRVRAERRSLGTGNPHSRDPVVPHVKQGHVEHTVYDTGSILRFITRRFGLPTLAGLKLRDTEMKRREGFSPGDLTEALTI